MKQKITLRNIALACGIMTTALLSAQPYCVSNLGGNFNCSGSDFITNVTIIGTGLNNNSTCNYVNNQAYTQFAPGPGTTANLIIGQTYSLSIFTGASNIESFWIDYNQNGLFDPSEHTQPTLQSIANAATVATFTVPFSALLGPTGLRVRSRAAFNNNGPGDACLSFGSGEAEDYTVTIVAGTPCSTVPGPNSVLTPTGAICPNSNIVLSGAVNYTVGGIMYQWASATNSVGPYTAIPSATNAFYNTGNLNANIWYRVVATCSNVPGLSTTYSPGLIQVASTTTNSVPYFEGFEDVSKSGNNELPNCSWTRSNAGNCKTSTVTAFSNRMPNTGIGFANFDYDNSYTSNVYNFYSNGIQLNAGVTYSAWVYYISPGWTAYTNFKLQYGPNQSQTGIINLGTVANPSNNTYSSLSNTFQVATSGIYYLNIQAQDNFSGSYFTFDDLGVIAPCSLANNAANMTINGPASICAGQTVNITAAGAGSYSWNNGPTTSSIQVSPVNDAVYTVVGTNTLSNCTTSLSLSMIVNPLPGVQIYAPDATICEGETAVLFASGSASSFTWSNGPTSPLNNVQANTPGVFTYSVIGANSYGCSSVATQVLNVNALPTLNVTGNLNICKGEPGTMTASGANTYTWSAATAYLQTNPVLPYPAISTAYTVSGTDANGCIGATVVNMMVNACTGIANVSGAIEGLQVYPNPNNGEFTVQLNNGLSKTIEVFDITGRSIVSNTSSSDEIKMNISTLSNGVYYVKVKSDNAVEVLKIVKQ